MKFVSGVARCSMGSVLVFILCGVGLFRDLSQQYFPSATSAIAGIESGDLDSILCFYCERRRQCLPSKSEAKIREILAACGAGQITLPRLAATESLEVRISEGGGISLAPLPMSLKVAFGLPVCLSEVEEGEWSLVPGVGRVLSARISAWKKTLLNLKCNETACALDSVRGIGATRAAKIRAFFGLHSHCQSRK